MVAAWSAAAVQRAVWRLVITRVQALATLRVTRRVWAGWVTAATVR